MKTKLLISLTLALLTAALGGCVKDVDPGIDPRVESVQTFILTVPGQDVVATSTRAMERDMENMIVWGDLLAFTESGIFAYARRIDPIDFTKGTNYNETVCKVKLKQSTGGAKYAFVLLANLPGGYISGMESSFEGKTKAQVLAAIKFDNTQGYYDDQDRWHTLYSINNVARAFPMWGEHAAVEVKASTVFSPVKMTRAVARIDVGLNFKADFMDGTPDNDYKYTGTTYAAQGLANFKLTKVQVRNVHVGGYVAPQGTNWTVDPKLPSATGTVRPSIDYAVADGKQFVRVVYIAESAAQGALAPLNATCLLVAGKYNGGPETWYRIDFIKGGTTNRLDILRNHRYIVNIKSVAGNGYATDSAALASDPVNIDAGVEEIDEDDLDNVVFDDQNYLAVSPGEFTFGGSAVALANTDNKLYIKTDVPGGWHIYSGGVVYTPIGENWLNFDTTTGAGDGTKQTVALTATANTGTTVRTATFYVTAGRLRMPVTVTQRIPYHLTSVTSTLASPLPTEPNNVILSVTGYLPANLKIRFVLASTAALGNAATVVGEEVVVSTSAIGSPAADGNSPYVDVPLFENFRPAMVSGTYTLNPLADLPPAKNPGTGVYELNPRDVELQYLLDGTWTASGFTRTQAPTVYAGHFAGNLTTGVDGGQTYYHYDRELWVGGADASMSAQWLPGGIILLGPTITNDWDGRSSTYNLVNIPPVGSTSAAALCYNKKKGTISSAADLAWYMPAQRQLIAVWTVQGTFGTYNFRSSSFYWSVTESDNTGSWYMYTDDGYMNSGNKTTSMHVRCVRE